MITSLWNVDDKSNAAIFKNFYGQQWQQQTSEALRQAKLNYLANAGDTKSSPYYWAGMIIFGVDDASEQGHGWLYAVGIAFITVVFIFIFAYKKNKMRKILCITT